MPTPDNMTQRDELNEILGNYGLGDAICIVCRHNIYNHYWNGAGNQEQAAWDSCKHDKCSCVGKEIERQPNTVYECPLQTIFVPSKGASSALLAWRDKAIAEAQTNAVAWCVGVLDDFHFMPHEHDIDRDKFYKGVKNGLRDRYQSETGIDPAPNYPVKATLSNPVSEEPHDNPE